MYLYKSPFGSHTNTNTNHLLAATQTQIQITFWQPHQAYGSVDACRDLGENSQWGHGHAPAIFFIFMLKYISFYFLQWSNNCHGRAPRLSHCRFAINVELLVCFLFRARELIYITVQFKESIKSSNSHSDLSVCWSYLKIYFSLCIVFSVFVGT